MPHHNKCDDVNHDHFVLISIICIDLNEILSLDIQHFYIH